HASGEGLPSKEGSSTCDDQLQASSGELLIDGERFDLEDIQDCKLSKTVRKLHFNLSFADALLHMPKFDLMFKSLLNNKEKLFDLATTPMNENFSGIILRKLLEKLEDPGKFLIPCDFSKLVECLALADLGARINLMPLSIWKKLSLPELTPTRMILKLADRSMTRPAGIAEDIFVKVEKFHFRTDFVVLDYVVDPGVPLILGRPFLRTERALIDVYGEELTLCIDDEVITFKVKDKQEKDKIRSKSDKNGKRGEAGRSKKLLQWIKRENLKKMQEEGPKMQSHISRIKERREKGPNLQILQSVERRGKAAKGLKL
nr:reverse transcriptase domain-containing protein [Tanacetum cinerariifolium]GFA13260.1 reverse transcriptase domain-containing protein [Tanacetum cinerariifolium]